jgi:hypothetical protein
MADRAPLCLSGPGPCLSGQGPCLSGQGPCLSGPGPCLSGSGSPSSPERVPAGRRPGARSRALSLGALALIALGCERAAPGPDECVAFAETWLRSRRPATRLEADTAFDELVRRCLTEPYDRELVECVVSGQNPDRCRVDYARRIEVRREERLR